MKKISLIALCIVCAICACAETIVLRTGARVKGEIVFQNDEVVIVRDASGARFQYPKSDVEQILSAEEESKEEGISGLADEGISGAEEEIAVSKKASILLELGGGAVCVPGKGLGGGFGVDFLVGSHHIGSRHLFIGGGLGYHGMFVGAEQYNFLPIQAAFRMPLTEEKHAPVFGVTLGYGIALSADYSGGLYAGMDFGYRCQLNEKTALALVAFAQFQQAKITVAEVVDDVRFFNKVGRYLILPGLKFALYF